MNTQAIVANLEDQLVAHGRLAGDDPRVEQTVDALVAGLGPALQQAVLELAEQAATEVGAQLSTGRVEVVLSEGEPALVVRSDDAEQTFTAEDLEARMTIRLPSNLKSALEEAADDAGDSMNSFVIKALASGASRGGKSRRIRETFET
jgi:hypothetical protein